MQIDRADKTPHVVARLAATPQRSGHALTVASHEGSASGLKLIDLSVNNPQSLPPACLQQEALAAIGEGHYEYGDASGHMELRRAVAEHIAETQKLHYDAETEVTITSGASAGLSATLRALVQGDCVAVLEPYFSYFIDHIHQAGAQPKFIPLRGDSQTIDETDLRRTLAGNIRFLILNSPHNPTGRVFTRSELEMVARVCVENDIFVISDDAYESFYFEHEPVSIASLPGMHERTVLLHSWAKTFNAPGWRVGSVTAPAAVTAAVRRVNNSNLGGACLPIQVAFARALPMCQRYAAQQRRLHKKLRDKLCSALAEFGFKVNAPQGTLSVFADCSPLKLKTDTEVCAYLLRELSIVAVPGSSFFLNERNRSFVRFSFARDAKTIGAAAKRLQQHGKFC